jgi:hypothetical protein
MKDGPGSGTDKADGYKMPRGITAVGVFFFFGATMASIAGTTLTWPGTFLDRLWVLNPTAHKQLATFAKPAGILFLLLAAMLAMAGTGWFKHRLWSISSGAIIGEAVLASALRPLCCFIFCVQR